MKILGAGPGGTVVLWPIHRSEWKRVFEVLLKTIANPISRSSPGVFASGLNAVYHPRHR